MERRDAKKVKAGILVFSITMGCIGVMGDASNPFELSGEMPVADILMVNTGGRILRRSTRPRSIIPTSFRMPLARCRSRAYIRVFSFLRKDLPALRERINNTISGRFFYHQITFSQEQSIRREGTFWSHCFRQASISVENRCSYSSGK
ncbi:hypothetical protein PDESU_04826 [Pontiella desulfatans]|uniref:Uncharacterized protein n=1 Tax=Pontiella desulfatans TaxID=2750659 RepID=A0A6C2U8F3_PONDE|nr:hypothetical protein PDESU_04826 [Pontiella desulfatans]